MAQVVEAPPLNEEEIQELYEWVDEIPLSRPKRNISRDFADAKMMAEIIKHFHPKLVELHNYPEANSFHKKLQNWETLNLKVFNKLGFQFSRFDIEQVVNCVPDHVERILKVVKDNLFQQPQKTKPPTTLKTPKQESTRELALKLRVAQERIQVLEEQVKAKDAKIQELSNKLYKTSPTE
mmetsp:Transcript_14207/g.20770  ORF Transcript_14207/g.20770 Transcript_14207/m.20770 type:complete len:180 (-) Transcript_14207:874-1413(-)